MLLFHCILIFMKDLFQSENQVFNPTRLLVLLHFLGGKDWVGPFFPSCEMYWSIYLSFSLLNYAALSLHLNTNVWPVQKRESSFQTSNILVLLHCRMGKDWACPIFPPSKLFLSFYLSFQSFGLCNSLNVSKQFWMTYSKVRIKFLTYKFIGTSTLWGGERLGRPILWPPSIMFGSFNLLSSLSVYVTLWLYLNNFEWPIPKRDQVFKPTS